MDTFYKAKVGDNVRSHDFDERDITGPNACYVEGIVESIEPHPMGGGGNFVKFKISKKIFGGKEIERTVGEYNWVPQNGSYSIMGQTTNIVLIDPEEKNT